MKWDVVVIGSGIGGLACAGMLAAQGRKVLVLEQAPAPGGYLASFQRGGFTFDSAVDCVAGLDPEGLLTWLLRCLGVDGGLTPIRLDPIRVSRFPGLTVQVDASLPAYIERLSRLFPSERRGIAAFFRRAGEIYSDVEAMLEAVKEGKEGADALPASWMRYRELTYADLLHADIQDGRLAAILSDRCPFLGSSPARVSATRMVSLVMSYFRSGAFRPMGGHQRLPALLIEGIQRMGGEVCVGRPAKKILLEGGRCARVLTEDGAECVADQVVSNADLTETFGRLVGGDLGTAILAETCGRALSPSFFIAYAGVRRDVSPGAASSIGSFEDFDLAELLDRYVPFSNADALGITIPTLEDPSLAPPGHDVFLVHELIPHGYARDWEREKDACLEQVLGKAERVFPGLMGRVTYCEAATPSTLERFTRNRGGAAYGWDQSPRLSRVRHGIGNLHLAGHWGEAGGGVLASAYSGMRVAARILGATA
ncbi:MAG TPA: NAD(P)/FAD-dependent oxidoreductase [Candidatus Methylomirabilis sp.]|nr:NAD(P)/FAD-dependent oxidoreductase [Candidatus Methylomirabilis sp.]